MARSGVDRNFRNLGARLRALEKYVTEEAGEITEYWTGEIERAAIRDAPAGGDRIRTKSGSIAQEQISEKRRGNNVPIANAIGYIMTNNKLTGTIYVDESAGDIAIYIEMGTGQSAASYLADKDPEWKALAMKYYVNGLGTIIAQPYILNNVLANEPKFIEDLKKLMGDLRL
jgi:hypothetical protein